MDKKTVQIMKDLINSIEGAPYPQTVNTELYTIWYEHTRKAANEALRHINRQERSRGRDLFLNKEITKLLNQIPSRVHQ